MKILKYIFLIVISISTIFASELDKKEDFKYPYKDFYQIKSYLQEHGGEIDFDLATKLNTDMNWLKGNDYLNNKRYKRDLTSDAIKNHSPLQKGYKGTNDFLERYKGSRKYLANFTTYKSKEALEEFYKSVKYNDNPVAAFEGLSIIYDYYSNNSEIKQEYKKFFAENLVKHDICWGYLVLGQMYQKGEFVKKNLNHALKIYEQGKPICKVKVPKSWQYKHLLSGYYGIKRFVK